MFSFIGRKQWWKSTCTTLVSPGLSRFSNTASCLSARTSMRFCLWFTCMSRLLTISHRTSAYFLTPNSTGSEVLYIILAFSLFPVLNWNINIIIISCTKCPSLYGHLSSNEWNIGSPFVGKRPRGTWSSVELLHISPACWGRWRWRFPPWSSAELSMSSPQFGLNSLSQCLDGQMPLADPLSNKFKKYKL